MVSTSQGGRPGTRPTPVQCLAHEHRQHGPRVKLVKLKSKAQSHPCSENTADYAQNPNRISQRNSQKLLVASRMSDIMQNKRSDLLDRSVSFKKRKRKKAGLDYKQPRHNQMKCEVFYWVLVWTNITVVTSGPT